MPERRWKIAHLIMTKKIRASFDQRNLFMNLNIRYTKPVLCEYRQWATVFSGETSCVNDFTIVCGGIDED